MSNNVTAKTYLALKSAALAILAIAVSLVSCTPEDNIAPEPITPDFSVEGYAPSLTNIQIHEGDSLLFINESTGGEYFNWVFNGGIPLSSNEENPSYIVFPEAGSYLIVLWASNDSSTWIGIDKENYITVLSGTDTTGCGTEVTDIDGNVYPVIEIGSQCWMQENLKTATYNDGTPIPTGLDDAAWSLDSLGAYAYYNDDPINNNLDGKLYNWYAVATGKLCPQGWHIPTQTDFQTLVSYIGGESQGGALKSTDYWFPPNEGATNSTGFSAYGSGFRLLDGPYYGVDLITRFWSSTENNDGESFQMYLANDNEYVYVEGFPKNNGLSCRCVKD